MAKKQLKFEMKMRKRLLILLIPVLLLVFLAWRNSSPSAVISALLNKGAPKEGNLRYKIYLLGILPVGDAVLKAKNVEDYLGRPVYHLSATAHTLKAISMFFSGSCTLDSYIDIENLSPMLFKQRLRITGKKDVSKDASYDQRKGIMSIDGTRRQILPNTLDPLSAIFNLRNMDFDITKDFEMNINTNQKNYILKGKAGYGELSINKANYKLIIVRSDIRRRDKNPYHHSRVDMVLLREKQNIPLTIKVFASGILFNAKLVAIE